MALGISFVAATPGYQEDLMSYLFGSILLVPTAEDLDAFKIEKMDVDGSTIEYDNLEPPGDNPLDAEMPF